MALQPIFLTLIATTVALVFRGKPAFNYPDNTQILGKWEVVKYSEQGIPVDKKAAALPQAVGVWQHNRKLRARIWYGYDEDYAKKRPRKYEAWEERDSLLEVRRVAEAIEMPYFAVFFADSTCSHYNREAATGRVYFPEVHKFVFEQQQHSLDFVPGLGMTFFGKTDAQVIRLTDTNLTIFIPDEAEIVELVRVQFTLP